jgi:hypothetical protein
MDKVYESWILDFGEGFSLRKIWGDLFFLWFVGQRS